MQQAYCMYMLYVDDHTHLGPKQRPPTSKQHPEKPQLLKPCVCRTVEGVGSRKTYVRYISANNA